MKTIEKQKTEKATRPASRWRNRYLALRDFREDCGARRCRGEEFWASRPWWPTRDTAQTAGQLYEAEYPTLVRHLGAFPMDAA